MTRTTLPLTSITVGERLRKDYGDSDMESLCDSMERLGLIQPIVVNQSNVLIAGGRRYAAATALGWASIDVVYRETLTEDELRELELEENLQRKEMTWQERVCSVAAIHYMKVGRNAIEGKEWGHRETGAMLNMSHGKIGYALAVATKITAGDEEVIKCEGVTEAIKLLWRREEEATQRELSIRTMTAVEVSKEPLAAAEPIILDDGTVWVAPVREEVIPEVSLGKMLFHQKDLSLSVMKSFPTGFVDHIVTDPPYGIDLDNISQMGMRFEDVEKLKVSHGVEQNLELFAHFLPEAYRVVKDKGFVCFWCDIMNWQYLYDLAIKAGFAVQRWPLVWCKTHQCLNQMAQYNYTKDIEIAMICRKKGAMLTCAASTTYFEESNESAKVAFPDHPFVKPLMCWRKILHHCTSPGDTVLEPFAGRGSGVISMLEEDRKVIAIEYDPTHFAYLVEKVKQYYIAKNPKTKFV